MKESNNNKVGILHINYDTGRAYWGPQLRDLLGVTRKVPANYHLLLKLVHPDDRRAVDSSRAQTLRPGCPARQEVEFRIVDATGEVRWLYAEVRVEFRDTASHDVVRVVGVVIDVTRVHLEASALSLAKWMADHRHAETIAAQLDLLRRAIVCCRSRSIRRSLRQHCDM